MSVLVVIYSRYCDESLQFLELLEKENNIKMDIRKLCIDNKKIQNQVLESKIGISKVPTIMVHHSNGEVEKYEEETCFEWLKFIMDKLKPEIKQTEVNQVEMKKVKKVKQSQILDEEDLVEDKTMIKQKQKEDEIPEKRELNTQMLIKKESSNSNLDTDKEQNEEKASERIKTQTEGIMNLAQQMQKERESS
jgi:hypothetical protein